MGYNEDMISIKKTDKFIKWVTGLRDKKAQALIAARIDRIAVGNFGDTKHVGDSVYELRIDYGPGYRMYFVQRGHEIIILLCGGDKTSQTRNIEAAKRIAKDLGGIV